MVAINLIAYDPLDVHSSEFETMRILIERLASEKHRATWRLTGAIGIHRIDLHIRRRADIDNEVRKNCFRCRVAGSAGFIPTAIPDDIHIGRPDHHWSTVVENSIVGLHRSWFLPRANRLGCRRSVQPDESQRY